MWQFHLSMEVPLYKRALKVASESMFSSSQKHYLYLCTDFVGPCLEEKEFAKQTVKSS